MREEVNERVKEVYLILKNLPLAFDGSKKKIFSWIAPLLTQEFEDAEIILDGFSGTGIVSAFLALNGHKVYANDILYSAYALTTTLGQNPGELLTDIEIEHLSSHRCVDQIIFDKSEIFENIGGVHIKYPGIFTTNESMWMKHLNTKIQNLSPYKQLIAHSAMRGISTIVPFSTSNGTKKFQHRITQKDKYGQRCLGFYYNSSYEIEYIKWFSHYVNAFQKAVTYFASGRQHDATVFRGDIFDVLALGIPFDAAYFDPPYGRKNRIGYEKMYAFQEDLLEADYLEHSIFTNPEEHSTNFTRLLEACNDIPKLVFSYDNHSWATIDEIALICKRFGRTISIMSTAHIHGKIPMKSHNTQTHENLIVAKK